MMRRCERWLLGREIVAGDRWTTVGSYPRLIVDT